MTKRMGTLVPWPESRILSSYEVHGRIREHWSKMAGMRSSIVYAHELFTHRKNIWPDQCERLLEPLNTISKFTRNFYEFLNMSGQLPLFVCPLRYPLAKSLHRIDVLLNEVSGLIISFVSSSQASPRQMQIRHLEIQQRLDYLLQAWKEAQHHVEVLLDQIEASMQEEAIDSQSHNKPLEFKAKKDLLSET